MVVRQNFLSY